MTRIFYYLLSFGSFLLRPFTVCFFSNFYLSYEKYKTTRVISRKIPRTGCQANFKVVKSCLPWQTTKQSPRVFARRTQLRSRANMHDAKRDECFCSVCASLCTRVSDTCHILPHSDCKDFVVSVIMGSSGDDCASFRFSLVDTSAPFGEPNTKVNNEPTFRIIQVTLHRKMAMTTILVVPVIAIVVVVVVVVATWWLKRVRGGTVKTCKSSHVFPRISTYAISRYVVPSGAFALEQPPPAQLSWITDYEPTISGARLNAIATAMFPNSGIRELADISASWK